MCNQNYKSLALDGKMLRHSSRKICEWCGGNILAQQLGIRRHYVLSNIDHRSEAMHLTCYDKARAWCAKYGHTFRRFRMQPLSVISSPYLNSDMIKGALKSYDPLGIHLKEYILRVSERHQDTMEPILYQLGP